MPDAADSLIAVADYFGVTSNNQQHFFFFFLEEHNFCTLVRDIYTVSNPVCRVIWFPHFWSRGEVGDTAKDLDLKIFLATVKLKKKKKKKAPFLNRKCLDTEKVPLHCSFIFYCILKIGNSNFVSRHFWYCEEVLRVLKGFTCFADLHVSSLWWCFFFFFPHREWVWSEVTEVIGRKMW